MSMRTLVFTLLAGSALVLSGCPQDGKDGPQGDPGAQGDTGPAGDQGPAGTVGATGANGPQGDTGATGPKGDTGVAGPKGDPGANGADAACADAEKLVITGVTGLGELNFTGDEIALTVGVEGADGGTVDDADIIIFGDMGPDFMPGDAFNTFKTTPETAGSFGYIVMATDGCSVAVDAFQLDAVDFEAKVSFVNLVPNLDSVIVAPPGETSGTEVSFGDRSAWVDLAVGTASWDIVNPDDDSLLDTIPETTFDYLSEQFIVAYPDGSDGVAFATVSVDDAAPTTDMWSLRVFNGTAANVKIYADDDTTVVFDTVTPGAVSAETNEYADASLDLYADVDGDDNSDFLVSIPDSVQYVDSNYVAFVYMDAGAPKVVFVEYDPGTGALADYSSVSIVDLNTAFVSLVHIAPNADGTLKIREQGGTTLKTVDYEAASDFFVTARTGTFEILDSSDAIVATVDLDMPKASRDSIVFYETGGALKVVSFAENDDSLESGNSRVGFFNGADGSDPVNVTNVDGDDVFPGVILGTSAGFQLVIPTADTTLLLDSDNNSEADAIFTLESGYGSGQLYSQESGTAFLYNTGSGFKVLYRSFTTSGTGSSAYDRTYDVSDYTPPAVPDYAYGAGSLADTPVALALPLDGTNTVQEQTITVSDTCTLSDLIVPIDITHAYRGDLYIELTSPAGTTIVLWDETGGSADDIIGQFVDGGTGAPFFSPAEPLATFAGEAAAGDWMIHVEDTWPSSDDGTFDGWGLDLFCQ